MTHNFPGAQFVGTGAALKPADIDAAARSLECHPAALRALIAVDCAKRGFGERGRVRAIYSTRDFSALTEGRHDHDRAISSPRWLLQVHGLWTDTVFEQIERAADIDRSAALSATLWGFARLPGAAFAACGYSSVGAMIEAFKEGEAEQLRALARYLRAQGFAPALQMEDFRALLAWAPAPFRSRERRLRDYLRVYRKIAGAPPLRIIRRGETSRAVGEAQRRLEAVGWPTADDGRFGARTEAALRGFQAEAKLKKTGVLDAPTWRALEDPPQLRAAENRDAPMKRTKFSAAKIAGRPRSVLTPRRVVWALIAAPILAELTAQYFGVSLLREAAEAPALALIGGLALATAIIAAPRYWPVKAQ